MADNKFWGNVFGFAGAIASLPVALAKGAFDKLDGGSFTEGADKLCTSVSEACEKFGRERGDQITNAAIFVAVSTIGSLIGKDISGSGPNSGNGA
jgi:hypothetical protein